MTLTPTQTTSVLRGKGSHWPTTITLSRIAAAPFMVWLWLSDYDPSRIWFTLIFFVAAISDLADGYVARRYGAVTQIGAMLDPIADKILFTVVAVLLISSGVIAEIHLTAVLIILTRELLISGLRESLGTKSVNLPVSRAAKYKTTFQLLSLGILCPIFAYEQLEAYITLMGIVTLWFACFITVWTGWDYVRSGVKQLSSDTASS